MNKKILFLTLLVVVVLPTAFVLAQTTGGATGNTLGSMGCKLKAAAVSIATPIVVIGWIIAGILYLTAAGKPEKINVAKGAMIACVVGTLLIVLALGSAVVIEIISNAFGITPPATIKISPI